MRAPSAAAGIAALAAAMPPLLATPSHHPVATPCHGDGATLAHVEMYDMGGNGWAGAHFALFRDHETEVVVNGTLYNGGYGAASVCVPAGTCYQLGLVGGELSSHDEISFNFVGPYGSTFQGCERARPATPPDTPFRGRGSSIERSTRGRRP